MEIELTVEDDPLIGSKHAGLYLSGHRHSHTKYTIRFHGNRLQIYYGKVFWEGAASGLGS